MAHRDKKQTLFAGPHAMVWWQNVWKMGNKNIFFALVYKIACLLHVI